MDIHSKQIDRIFEKIALKHGIHKNTVRMIIMTEFEMIKDIMGKVDSYNNYFPYIRLEYFGVFKVKKNKRKFFLEKSKKIIEDVYSQSEQGDNRTSDVIDSGIQKDLG
jgi:nucleoid DNA-binding protein